MARILGVDIPRNKAMRVALTYIYGIGNQLSKDVLTRDRQVCTQSALRQPFSSDKIKRILVFMYSRA